MHTITNPQPAYILSRNPSGGVMAINPDGHLVVAFLVDVKLPDPADPRKNISVRGLKEGWRAATAADVAAAAKAEAARNVIESPTREIKDGGPVRSLDEIAAGDHVSASVRAARYSTTQSEADPGLPAAVTAARLADPKTPVLDPADPSRAFDTSEIVTTTTTTKGL